MAANPAPEDMSARLYAGIRDQLTQIEQQQAVVQRRIEDLPAGGFDPELPAAASRLARAWKELAGEHRQLEKHDKRMTLTPEQRFAELLKYVRTLSPPQITVLRETLVEMQRGRAA
jgi:hypothetical protein